VTKEAVEKARGGGGPTLIEAVTYRIGAHSSSDDPTRYRSTEEVEQWKQRDPIERFRKYLREKNLWTEEFEARIQSELDEQIGQAIKEAEAAPAPSVETIFEDVYAQMPWHLRQQLDSLIRRP
jgi:pyruvate dehydrogenase E1 component alpha subunit/2-oxoisovalerate dehydrogenase E1 component alpha subunit